MWLRSFPECGGRGAGKTRAGVEHIRSGIKQGHFRRVAMIGPTADAVRQIMVEGPSGLLAIAPQGVPSAV